MVKRIAIWVTILCAASLVIAPSGFAQKQLFRIGSASVGSSGYIHWEACAFLANKYSEKLKASSLSTGGSTESVFLIDQKKIEVGHGTSLEVVAALAAEKPFTKKFDIWQVFAWTNWAMPMVALADSPLKTYYDLKGKQVSMIKKGSGTESLYRILMEEYGLFSSIKKNFLSFDESKDALVDGLIVAFPGNYPDGKPNPTMLDLAARKPYKVLELDLEVMKKANARNKGIVVTTLPKSAYELLTKDMASPGFIGIGLSSAHADDESVYEFCKAVLDHIDELKTISKVTQNITLQNAAHWLVPGYPVHPGAARYFKEKGVWRDDLVVGKR